MKKETTLFLNKLDKLFTEYLLKKAPTLPDNIKEFLAKYLPYLVIIGLVFSIGPVIALFGITSLVVPFAMFSGARFGFNYLSTIILLISLVVQAVAVPGLFKRTMASWNLMYYAALINAVHNLVRFDIVGLIIGTGISLYFLYQIKSFYKK